MRLILALILSEATQIVIWKDNAECGSEESYATEDVVTKIVTVAMYVPPARMSVRGVIFERRGACVHCPWEP